MDNNKHWVGTWATSPAPSEAGVGFNNHTLRMNPCVSIGGDTLRVRVSNAYGSRKLEIGAAYVGIRDKGPATVPGSERKLTFSGSGSATIAAGALVVSDSVQLDVLASPETGGVVALSDSLTDANISTHDGSICLAPR